MDAGDRWTEARTAYASNEGGAGIVYARRRAAAAEMERLEAAYADGTMTRDDTSSLRAAMEAARLPFTQAEIGVGAIVRQAGERRRLRRLRGKISRVLARFDAMVDGLDVYGPRSRAGDHDEEGGKLCPGQAKPSRSP